MLQTLLAFTASDIDTIEQGVGLNRIDSLASLLNGTSQTPFGIVTLFTFAGGAFFIIYLILGGIKMMTSSGDPRAVGDARQMIMNALIGLIIVIFAFWIVEFLGYFLGLPGIQNTFNG